MEILNTKKNIVLGSNSPRRSELLKLMGFDFTTRKIHVNENHELVIWPESAMPNHLMQNRVDRKYLSQKLTTLSCSTAVHSTLYLNNTSSCTFQKNELIDQRHLGEFQTLKVFRYQEKQLK